MGRRRKNGVKREKNGLKWKKQRNEDEKKNDRN